MLHFATEALYFLATIHSPETAFSDPRNNKLDWNSMQSLASLLTRLVVDCVEHAKPQNWSIVSLDHSNMAPVRRCLALVMRSLFNRISIRFLQSIYLALRDHNVLNDHHLTPFITENCLKLVQQWSATDSATQDDNEPEEQ